MRCRASVTIYTLGQYPVPTRHCAANKLSAVQMEQQRRVSVERETRIFCMIIDTEPEMQRSSNAA